MSFLEDMMLRGRLGRREKSRLDAVRGEDTTGSVCRLVGEVDKL